MTFSVSRDHGLFEWAGKSLATVFCQPSRLLDMRMWRLLYDVLRFNACARRLVMRKKGQKADELEGLNISLGEYLKQGGYSDAFRDDYLVVGVFRNLGKFVDAEPVSTANDRGYLEYTSRQMCLGLPCSYIGALFLVLDAHSMLPMLRHRFNS